MSTNNVSNLNKWIVSHYPVYQESEEGKIPNLFLSEYCLIRASGISCALTVRGGDFSRAVAWVVFLWLGVAFFTSLKEAYLTPGFFLCLNFLKNPEGQ